MKRAGARWVFAGLACAASIGCATARPIPPVDTSAVRYRAAALKTEDLARSPVVVLPVMTRDADSAQWARLTDERITAELQTRQPTLSTLSAAETMARIQEAGADDRLRTLLDSSDRVETLDRTALGDVALAARGRYVLLSMLWVVHSTQPFPGGSTEAAVVEIQSQLWDGETGELVWEGTGGGAAPLSVPVTDGGSPYAAAVYRAAEGLARRLGKGASDVPAAMSVQAVHTGSQQEIMRTEATNEAQAEVAATGFELFFLCLEGLLD